MGFIFYFLLISFIYCDDGKKTIESSQINANLLSESELYLRINLDNNQRLAYGIQWWASPNLYIYGCIAPNIKDNKTHIYHKLALGHTISSNSGYFKSGFELSVHRQRYNISPQSLWYETTLHNKFNKNNFFYGFSISKLFSNNFNSIVGSVSFAYIISPLLKLESNFSIDMFKNFYPSLNLNIII